MTDVPADTGDGDQAHEGMSAAWKVFAVVLVAMLLVLVGVMAFFLKALSIPDRDTVPTIGSASLAQRPTLEESHAELWPLGHEFMRQVEAETGVVFALSAGRPDSYIAECDSGRGWMEKSATFVTTGVDLAVLDTIGQRVFSGRFPTRSTNDYGPGESYLYWGNPDGSSFRAGVDRDGNAFVGWSSGCALSSVYPPPYTTPWPSGLPTWPTPLPDPEAPTVTASPLPSSPAAPPTPTSSPS